MLNTICYGTLNGTLDAICRARKAYLKILPNLKLNNYPQYYFLGQCFSATATTPTGNFIILLILFTLFRDEWYVYIATCTVYTYVDNVYIQTYA